MTNVPEHNTGIDDGTFADDARLELAFTHFFDGLIDEARQIEGQRAFSELARANQQYMSAGYRRLYEYLTGVPLEQSDNLKARLLSAAHTGHGSVEQIRDNLRGSYANGSTGDPNSGEASPG